MVGGELVLLGVRPRPAPQEDEAFLSVVSLKSGKLVRVRERLESVDPRFLLLDGTSAYVVSREKDASFAVRAVSLGDLATRWEAKAGGGKGAVPLPPGLAKDHVVVTWFEHDRQEATYSYVGTLLDKEGRVVQNIRSAKGFERPPEATIANDAVIFSVDSVVEVHR